MPDNEKPLTTDVGTWLKGLVFSKLTMDKNLFLNSIYNTREVELGLIYDIMYIDIK